MRSDHSSTQAMIFGAFENRQRMPKAKSEPDEEENSDLPLGEKALQEEVIKLRDLVKTLETEKEEWKTERDEYEDELNQLESDLEVYRGDTKGLKAQSTG